MLEYLFDLSYERNLDEAKVFYFVYVFFACLIAGIFRFYTDIFLTEIRFVLTFCSPLIFYTLISINIVLKKRLKDRISIYFTFCTVAITLLFPLCFALGSFIWSNFLNAGFIQECGMAFRICFFPSLILGCIPVTLLTMKEDNSLKKEIQKMEQEKLEHEQWIEKQLLTERAIASKIVEIKKQADNLDEKDEPYEKQ